MVGLYKIRKCYICHCSMRSIDFIYMSIVKNVYETLGREMLEDIWKNDIFVIKCCCCF